MKTLYLEQVKQLLSEKDYSDLARNYSHFINSTDEYTSSLYYYDSDTNEVVIMFTEGGIYLDHTKETHRYTSELSFEQSYDVVYPNKIGRPSLGVTKKVSITLPEDLWDTWEEFLKNEDQTKSAFLRSLIISNFEGSEKE